ncbi:MAG: hypothetical protein DWB89_02665 [Candidatus Poseidoniales archaeon]|nr:hypothetical protein [Candidatus Thalassarchaeum sp.]RJU87084.1 MAG: hypothetical protein DWB89_02665 [Candidatus Poseidoniales archaeon]
MIESIIDFANSEGVAYLGMTLILSAFLLETRDFLNSKSPTYLWMMAGGAALLAIRAYLIDEWAFFILEAVWFLAAVMGLWALSNRN